MQGFGDSGGLRLRLDLQSAISLLDCFIIEHGVGRISHEFLGKRAIREEYPSHEEIRSQKREARIAAALKKRAELEDQGDIGKSAAEAILFGVRNSSRICTA